MEKPRLSAVQIWNMCFGFLGIQIGFALQNANVSRIFQTLGAEIDQVALLWLAAPVTGLLVQPIIGYMSDRTWGPLGRRRPYFLGGAILTSVALLAMPNAPALWVAASMLWIMDASLNITMEPFRAYVGDNLPRSQHASGYATQAVLIGVGAVFASALPWMLANWFGVSNTAAAGETPDSVRLSFYIGGVALLAAVGWTVFTSREYSPAELARFEPPAEAAEGAGADAATGAGVALAWALVLLGGTIGGAVLTLGLAREIYLLAGLCVLLGLVLALAAALKQRGRTRNPLVQFSDDLVSMPKPMRQLALVQFFAWFALFAMWIYTTPAITAHHFGSTDPTSPAYARGADWTGVLFAVYNGVAAIAALFIPILAQRIGLKATHIFNLLLGAAGLAAIPLVSDPNHLWLPMIGVGFAWASILSAPYAMLAGALPAQKLGLYMGVFNFFIVIPQLIAATALGATLRGLFGGEAIYAMALGAGAFVIAAACTALVSNEPHAKPAASRSAASAAGP